jgi:hypothetical protein
MCEHGVCGVSVSRTYMYTHFHSENLSEKNLFDGQDSRAAVMVMLEDRPHANVAECLQHQIYVLAEKACVTLPAPRTVRRTNPIEKSFNLICWFPNARQISSLTRRIPNFIKSIVSIIRVGIDSRWKYAASIIFRLFRWKYSFNAIATL